MGLGFGTVVISDTDTETEAAVGSTAAALRVTCCVLITRARERGLVPGLQGRRLPPPGGLRG
ncbi:hypothetical protein ACWDV7_23960 [Streptomyces sp. NPDC003362]